MSDRDELEALRARVAAQDARLAELARVLGSGGFSSLTVDGLARTLRDAARALGGRS